MRCGFAGLCPPTLANIAQAAAYRALRQHRAGVHDATAISRFLISITPGIHTLVEPTENPGRPQLRSIFMREGYDAKVLLPSWPGKCDACNRIADLFYSREIPLRLRPRRVSGSLEASLQRSSSTSSQTNSSCARITRLPGWSRRTHTFMWLVVDLGAVPCLFLPIRGSPTQHQPGPQK